MRAVILAGGRGTRLGAHTAALPKALVPYGDRPVLEVILRQLRHHGVGDVTLCVGHLAELVVSHFGDGERFGLRIGYSREAEPLGTAGPLSLLPRAAERFFVLNADVLTTLDFSVLLARHVASGAVCTMAMHTRRIALDLGVAEHDARLRLTRYVEKPVHEVRVGMGIHVFEPRVLDFIPPARRFDLPELMNALVAAGEHVHCYPFEGYWLDIGRPDAYAQALTERAHIERALCPGA